MADLPWTHERQSLGIDLFRCESILLKSHRVLVAMDKFTRRIIGFGVHAGDVDGVALCRMFNTAISTKCAPKPILRVQAWSLGGLIND